MKKNKQILRLVKTIEDDKIRIVLLSKRASDDAYYQHLGFEFDPEEDEVSLEIQVDGSCMF